MLFACFKFCIAQCVCVCVSNFSSNMRQQCDTCQEGSGGSNLRLPATKHSARGRPSRPLTSANDSQRHQYELLSYWCLLEYHLPLWRFSPGNPSKSQGLFLRCSESPAPRPSGFPGSSGWWMAASCLVQILHLYSDRDSWGHKQNWITLCSHVL